MIPALRQRFNREFTPDRYAAFVAGVETSMRQRTSSSGCPKRPSSSRRRCWPRLEGVAQELIAQLLGNARLSEGG